MATCLIMQLRLKKKKILTWLKVPRFVLKVLQTTVVHYGKVQYPSTSRKTQWNSLLLNYFPTIA
jgi:hypothetical protein